jgi:hypothetical protein
LAISAHLLIDGTPIQYLDGAHIYFADFLTMPQLDTITIGGMFTKAGVPLDIGSVVGVSPSTFTF